jgi:hypothetical protein
MAKHRNEAERRREVARWRASGMDAGSYCAAHDISEESLRRWRGEAEGRRAATAPAFLRLEVTGARERRGLTVEVGPARVQVEEGFDAKLLREVVAAISGSVLA